MEKVLAVKAEKLGRHLEKEGLVTENTDEILSIILENQEFIDRDAAETDASYRQIIPYVVISREGRVLLLQRLKTQTEKRLHGKLSIGIGGHINPIDGEEGDVIAAGLRRELDEEVGEVSIRSLKFCGIINDYSSEVSFYHLGLLYTLEAGGEVSVRETSKMTGRFVPAGELAGMTDSMETWSKVVVDSIYSDIL